VQDNKKMESIKRTISNFTTTILLSENSSELSIFCENKTLNLYLIGEFTYKDFAENQKNYVDNVGEIFILVKEVSDKAIKI